MNGKTALITGSGRNIGRATALEFAARGANVVVNARSNRHEAEAVAEEARELGVRAIAVVADVGSLEDLDRLAEAALTEFGRVDVLVNNAGLRRPAPITEMSVEDWHEVLAVNLDAPFYLSKALIPGMIEAGGGRIINVSGLNAFRGHAGWAHVSASKMGALGLTRALAMELAPHNILVNHVVPGAIDTYPANAQPPTHRTSGIPLGRLGLSEEIAKTCAFLASEDAAFITGQTIHVNGGALTY